MLCTSSKRIVGRVTALAILRRRRGRSRRVCRSCGRSQASRRYAGRDRFDRVNYPGDGPCGAPSDKYPNLERLLKRPLGHVRGTNIRFVIVGQQDLGMKGLIASGLRPVESQAANLHSKPTDYIGWQGLDWYKTMYRWLHGGYMDQQKKKPAMF